MPIKNFSQKLKADLIMVPENIPAEITEADQQRFQNVVSTALTPDQERTIRFPERVFPDQRDILAVHWHPEFIPLDLVRDRIAAMYPRRENELVIPTQHNVLVEWGEFSGVEVDCYSRGFNQKVQLLLHFQTDRLGESGVLKEMLAHTYRYRAGQLFDFIRTIIRPDESRLDEAVRQTGANAALVQFVQVYVEKISALLKEHDGRIHSQMIRNKLLMNFFDELREVYGNFLIDRAQAFLRSVKQIVKAGFSLEYFYRTSEVIEEARGLGGGIVIPHPEQFWPVLLADYDVDGYEVWNPQSNRYTEFLISVLREKNCALGLSRRRLLIFMGDDTHLGEKVRNVKSGDTEKAGREVGFQPAWDDVNIQKGLILADMDRKSVVAEYRNRLREG